MSEQAKENKSDRQRSRTLGSTGLSNYVDYELLIELVQIEAVLIDVHHEAMDTIDRALSD